MEDPSDGQFDDAPPDGFEGPPRDLYAYSGDEQPTDAAPAPSSQEQEVANSSQ